MLTIENLYVRYDSRKEVLKGVNFSMETGKTHGFVGLNGAGKTTLLNTLYGFLKPSGGSLCFEGNPLRRKEIAYLEAENYFYPYMTGREYIELFPAGPSGFSLDDWQELFSLPLDEITESYSTGMRKRLALMAVIKQDKPLLILDEPFNGLDMEGTLLLSLILSRLHAQGKTILLTSHIYETLTGCCDFIHYLADGQIMRSCPKPEFNQLHEQIRATVETRSLSQIEGLL